MTQRYVLKRDQLLRAIASGATISGACRGADVGRATFYRWKDRPDFREDLDRAVGEREAELLAGLVKMADARQDWRAYAWLLATLNPQRWGNECRCRVHGRGRRV